MQRRTNTLMIGLTGGPGVGKSEAATVMGEYGAAIINADQIGHELLRSNKTVKRKLIQLFGSIRITSDGNLDRKAIGKLVFGDPEKMVQFNKIIHPPLLKELKKQMGLLGAKKSSKLVAVDAALIFEWGIADWFDYIVVIDSSREIRFKRLQKLGLSRAEANKRITSQIPQKDKKALADFVIVNNATKKDLAKKVKNVAGKLTELV